jgi:predicted pyridoxine 5'-phosphate oxidase superfamily flavin-nucleotide-binding protein
MFRNQRANSLRNRNVRQELFQFGTVENIEARSWFRRDVVFSYAEWRKDLPTTLAQERHNQVTANR